MLNDVSNHDYEKILLSVPGLKELIEKFHPQEPYKTKLLLMEFALHGLSEYSLLSKFSIEKGLQFKDMLSSMFNKSSVEEEEYEGEEDSLL